MLTRYKDNQLAGYDSDLELIFNNLNLEERIIQYQKNGRKYLTSLEKISDYPSDKVLIMQRIDCSGWMLWLDCGTTGLIEYKNSIIA